MCLVMVPAKGFGWSASSGAATPRQYCPCAFTERGYKNMCIRALCRCVHGACKLTDGREFLLLVADILEYLLGIWGFGSDCGCHHMGCHVDCFLEAGYCHALLTLQLLSGTDLGRSIAGLDRVQAERTHKLTSTADAS